MLLTSFENFPCKPLNISRKTRSLEYSKTYILSQNFTKTLPYCQECFQERRHNISADSMSNDIRARKCISAALRH